MAGICAWAMPRIARAERRLGENEPTVLQAGERHQVAPQAAFPPTPSSVCPGRRRIISRSSA
jgi:hypothetical protein